MVGLQICWSAVGRLWKKTAPKEDLHGDADVDGRTEKKIIADARQQLAQILE